MLLAFGYCVVTFEQGGGGVASATWEFSAVQRIVGRPHPGVVGCPVPTGPLATPVGCPGWAASKPGRPDFSEDFTGPPAGFRPARDVTSIWPSQSPGRIRLLPGPLRESGLLGREKPAHVMSERATAPRAERLSTADP